MVKRYIWMLNIFYLGELYSQKEDFISDWNYVISNYQDNLNYKVEAVYTLYAGHESKKIVSTSQSLVIRSKNNIYQKIESMETIMNDEYLIHVDHQDKIIIFDRSIKRVFDLVIPADIQKYITFISEVSLISKNNLDKKYAAIAHVKGEGVRIRKRPRSIK